MAQSHCILSLISSPEKSDQTLDFLLSAIEGTMETTPTESIRSMGSEYSISKSCVQRIICMDLGLHPYKITLVQNMKTDEAERSLVFCDWFLEKVNSNPDF